MKQRNLILFSILILFLGLPLKGQVSFGTPELLNDNWKFTLNEVENGQNPTLNDRHWQTVNLPHDWSVQQQLSPSLASCTGYLPGGIGWYRKTFTIPQNQKDKKVYLYFEGVYNRSEVYINGESLGKRPNGYISFMFDATPYINYDQENTIAVRVDHSEDADSRWYTGSGIYRNVWLVYANPVHIDQWGVFVYPKNVTSKKATMQVDVEVVNHSSVKEKLVVNNQLFSPEGKVVASKKSTISINPNSKESISLTLNVNNPRLWDLESPNLYQLKTKIYKGKDVLDQTTTTTGIRSYTFDPNKGFALNGEWMKVKGVCLHHDAGVLGSAVPREVWKRRLLTLKEVGCNAIRTSHNPQAPDVYQLCDELGLLVLNEAYDEWEFPKRKWIEGWNVGKPGFQGSYDIFADWSEQDLADMVKRDRNHISIFAWSIGNEVDYPNDPYSHPVLDGGRETGFTQPIHGGYQKDAPDANRLGNIAKRLVKVVKEYDSSRPTTAGLAGVAMSNETEYPGALDIAGYNYTESRYGTDHEKYPNRVIYGSENRHELKDWKAVTENEHIFGQFLWTGIDYLGESGRWPSRGFYSGLLDFGGFIKPRGYYRQSLWSNQPMAYLGTYPTPGKNSGSQMKDVWSQLEAQKGNYEEKVPSMDAWAIWNYNEGQSIRVVCYTNCSQAELLLNGNRVGNKKPYNNETGIIYWDIPYQAGNLEVIAYDNNNKEVTRNTIQSSGRPHAITIQSVDKVIDKNRGLSQVVIQIVDDKNIPVMLSDNEVTCDILGPGKLLGLEASNNEDMSDYTDNVHRVFHGKMVAYIEATGEEGDIHVRFSSPWIKDAELTITVK
ncbi:MAG: glycoside hydrolase family 2 protein [Bacteroidales bacterium]|nr:glycoside hydrolase family 2 protein [Bacteroidales bacterium]